MYKNRLKQSRLDYIKLLPLLNRRCQMHPRRYKLLCCFFAGSLSMFLLMTFLLSRSNEETVIKQEILDLSRDYIHGLAIKQANLLDSPVAMQQTQYDLKKTMSVLLDSILGRLDKLEEKHKSNSEKHELKIEQTTSKESNKINYSDLLEGKQENCSIPNNLISLFPHCKEKLNWMKIFWESDPCYARLGVDGTKCSLYVYLSEHENYCPPLPFRKPIPKIDINGPKATIRTDFEPLIELLRDNPKNYDWMKRRLNQMWNHWVSAAKDLQSKQNWTLVNRNRKRILLHMGLLTRESNFKFGEKSLKGGPLGELVQWTDLIACLYILGHELFISSESKTFISFTQADFGLKSSCNDEKVAHVDLIYTDIVGYRQMKKKASAAVNKYRCRIRILDSFGTQAEFNDPTYFMTFKKSLGSKTKNIWGGHKLDLKQFYTMYPHSPDNTFLGFVVEMYSLNKSEELTTDYRKNWALIYGKEAYMWKGAENYISMIHEHFEVHSTVAQNEFGSLPQFVVNHGVLPGPQFHQLLHQVKLFVGLGFPYEGPAPLEAIANGAIFLNPKFNPPKGRRTDSFFADKPNLRVLTSQNPYVEEFIGPPYVISFDIKNETQVKHAIETAKKTQVTPFLPFEFTALGMLQRVNSFVEHQDLCSSNNNWPPFSACQIVVGDPGQSCRKACSKKDLICENSYFRKINNEMTLEKYNLLNKGCKNVLDSDEITSPRFDKSGYCYIQNNDLRYNCASYNISHIRLCPCRDFIKDQTALCTACL